MNEFDFNEALSQVGSAGIGIILARGIENAVPGYAGSGIALAIGGAGWAFGPEWSKTGTAILAGYGALSAIKKVAFKPEERRTGFMAQLEDAIPGDLLPAPGVQGLQEGYDDYTEMDNQYLLEGFGNIEDQLAGDIQDSLAGFGNVLDDDESVMDALAGYDTEYLMNNM